MEQISGTIVRNEIAGTTIRFFVAEPGDIIQQVHCRGEFYEPEELAIIAEYFPSGGVFVDVGANIGNHTIYVGKFLRPGRIVVFEPNPLAVALLQINIALNGLQDIADVTHLGIGLADGRAHARMYCSTPWMNLGGTHLLLGGDAPDVDVAPGDEFLLDRQVDFIKIDVERMEMLVLHGLAATIARYRPKIFIEIDQDNAPLFDAWQQANGYQTVRRFRRYESNENLMLLPAECLRRQCAVDPARTAG